MRAVDSSLRNHYLTRLCRFLGNPEIESQLSRIDRELAAEKGIYLQEFLLPRRAWWLGLKEARDLICKGRSLRYSCTPNMDFPIQTAVKLSDLYPSLPPWKRDEFRSRILHDDALVPTLFEIDVAFQFLLLGYSLEWVSNRGSPGERIPEFVAIRGDHQVEVECKAKQVDAGRRVERGAFYRTVDELIPIFEELALCGVLSISVPGRLPTTPEWRRHLANFLRDHIAPGRTSFALPGGEELECEIRAADGTQVPIEQLTSQMKVAAHPHAHFAFWGNRHGNVLSNPIMVRLQSANRDAFLRNVLKSLRDAEDQFTGTRAALICCFLPEIDSFEGIESDSALKTMTGQFFGKNARDCINAVCYVSDPRSDVEGPAIQTQFPVLVFRNPNYNEGYGPHIPILENSSNWGQ